MSFGGVLRQSTAVDVLIGPFVDSTDGDAEETGLTIAQADVRLSKNGQTGAQKSDVTSAAHDADGFYNCELDATDTNTVGQLTLYVHVAGALCVRHDYQVVEEAVYDRDYAAAATGIVGTAQTGDAFARLGAPAGASVSADIAAVKVDTAAILVDTGTTLDARIPAALVSGRMDCSVGAMAANVMTAAAAAADLTTELQSGLATSAALATVDTVVDAIKLSTDNLPSDPADQSLVIAATNAIAALIGTPAGVSVSADVAAVKSDTAAILTDTGTTLDGKIDTIDTVVDAIKAKTDSLTFTVAGQVDANVQSINDVTITGDGQVGTEFGV